ncbi:SnoaL-like domain-containing protein [Saccharopolyspora kobensis]|uniref:SnoaL-like domain-containing protein n=1 Tax=Saccharopolyspora kobensis TaxID=146035 RepID=A0A1H6EEZ8_9PSEU|nr:nuclear transport factor 2 family protein [Saccharopolyspora kobensis]SEG96362.1 SnoaL-like domain-containing protein [Saccharopolyspora kobensis]SFD20153.1 SnoaL-like domain-containing protein [Saccharopolyspora kobensis]
MPTDIADRIEIADLFTRLARLLDEKRWAETGDVFADDVAVHSPRGGELRGIDEVTGYLSRSDDEAQRTQHMTADLQVNVTGDEATASANSLVHFYRDGRAPHQTSGLRLFCTTVRTPVGWRIRDYRIVPAWTREN